MRKGWAEHQATIFEVSALPSFVFTDASAFSLVLVHILLVLLQLYKFPERPKKIASQAPKDFSIIA